MAIELSTLLTAAGSISPILKDMVPFVKTISSGIFFRRNEEAKRQLTEKLQEIQQHLRNAGNLAQVAEMYSRTHENVLELLWLCRRAERFLSDNLDDFRNRSNASYAGNWKVLDTLFETIDSSRDAPRKAVLDRGEWYDATDKAQVELKLQEFTSAYERASVGVRSKAADELLPELRGMTRPLLDAENLLRSTVYDKILRSLQRLSS
jgi:hypothetical protein